MPEGRGFLRVAVTEANGAIPAEGALVLVTDYGAENDVLYLLRTDEGGLTGPVGLPAPPAGDSREPGGEEPAGLYGVTVRDPGYYPVEAVGVQIYDGVTTVLPVDLVPLSEADSFGESGQVMLYETPETEGLVPGGVTRDDIGNRNGEITGGDLSNRERGGAE